MDDPRPPEEPSAPPGPLQRAEAWLAGRRIGVVILLAAAAVLFRVAYFLEINGGPCSAWHRWDQSDLHFFDQWGRQIAGGDWLSKGTLHPFHEWHARVARTYFEARPGEEEELRRQGGEEPARALWNRWYGGRLFHQEPLYPYLVGITYGVFGPDPRWVYASQMALGVVSILFVWVIARRHFGDLAAGVAGALAVLCGPVLFYEMVLLRTSLTVFAALGLFLLFEEALDRGGPRRWALAGAALGAALLLQTTFILFGVVAFALLFWRSRTRWREALRPAGAAAGIALLCLTPAFARNVAVGAPVFGLSAVGPVTFIASNARGYDPSNGFTIDDRAVARIMADTGGRFGGVVREVLGYHTPASYLGLLAGKFAVLWHGHELPNNKNFLYYRKHAPILGSSFVTFLVIAPLAAVGLAAAGREASRHALLYGLAAAVGAPLLIFYVLSRFRAPFAMALMPFAALALVRIADWVLGRRWKPAAVAAAGMFVMVLWVARPLPAHQLPIRSADYRVAYLTYWQPREREAVARSDWNSAASVLEEALAEEPDEVRRIDGSPVPEGRVERRRVAAWFEVLHGFRADLLGRAGRAEEARAESNRAEILKRSRE
jgi:4-amino-4-deoxy-L-arabinose transferase-like glycosyltransferase